MSKKPEGAPFDMGACDDVLNEVMDERFRQHDRFGEQNLPDGTAAQAEQARGILGVARAAFDAALKAGELTYKNILDEEFWEAMCETDPAKLRAELVQVAAVAVAWIEAIDRRGGK